MHVHLFFRNTVLSFLLPIHFFPVTLYLLPVAFPSCLHFPAGRRSTCRHCLPVPFLLLTSPILSPSHLSTPHFLSPFYLSTTFFLTPFPIITLSFFLVAFHGLLILFFIHVAFPSINNFLTFCRLSICLYSFLYSNRSTCQNCPSCRRFTHLTPLNTVHPFELSHAYITFPVAIHPVNISIFLSPFLL